MFANPKEQPSRPQPEQHYAFNSSLACHGKHQERALKEKLRLNELQFWQRTNKDLEVKVLDAFILLLHVVKLLNQSGHAWLKNNRLRKEQT